MVYREARVARKPALPLKLSDTWSGTILRFVVLPRKHVSGDQRLSVDIFSVEC